MIINKEILDYVVKETMSFERQRKRAEDLKRFLMYNGQSHDIIKQAVAKSFKKPESVEEIVDRIVPINIIQKIINKLSGVYIEAPARKTVDRNTSDEELIELYSDAMLIDLRMKEANRYFKLFKRNLQEIYVNDNGIPQLRNLPRHTYEVFSFNKKEPTKPEVIVKILCEDSNNEKTRLAVWSDKSFLIVNGKGQVDIQAMISLDNTDLINSYGVFPFVYINEASYAIDPIQDDDLVRCTIAILIILADLCFAQKYASWGIMYTIGNVGDVPVNPNSVINLQFGPDGQRPEVGSIKPEVDTEKVIMLIKTMLAMLLSTKNLSTSTVKTDLDSSDVASGISKMLDNAESVEDKKDQQSYFKYAEYDLWEKLSKFIIPYWRKNNLLAPELNREFSSSFNLSIQFQEPKVLITDKEKAELAKLRLESNLSTLKQELQYIYPSLDISEIEELEEEIMEEKISPIISQMDEAQNESELNDEVLN